MTDDPMIDRLRWLADQHTEVTLTEPVDLLGDGHPVHLEIGSGTLLPPVIHPDDQE